MFESKLIALYFYVSERYNEVLKYQCQRMSNNARPVFTDEEVLTIYLYAVREERRFKIKDIYTFANNHLRSWFPNLHSYQAFNNRLNRLSSALQQLCASLIEEHIPSDCDKGKILLDSMPIITCSGKRSGKVATAITNKGYCSTKTMYYYGLKLHVLGWNREKQLPWPESIVITDAGTNDLTAFKEHWAGLEHHNFYGDKIYHHKEWFESLSKNQNSQMFTPVKATKGMSMESHQFNKAADDLYSTYVSRIRQPIESFFNWIIEKTDIQRASKVRSTNGLLLHIFGKIAAAFIDCIFNP